MFINGRFITTPRILFEEPGDQGKGIAEAVEKAFANFLDKSGSDKDAAKKLYEENYEHRKEIRELKEKLEKVDSLSEEDRKLFDSLKSIYTEAGFEKPEDLKETLENSKKAVEELTTLKKEKTIAEVAEVAGYNAKVLNRIGGDKEYEIKTKEVDGKEVKYVQVKDGDTFKNLDEYAKEEWEDLLPALSVKQEENNDGKTFHSQSSSRDRTGSDDPIARRLERNKKDRGIEDEK